MRKEIEEFAKTITAETKIENIIDKVESVEEVKFLLQNIKSQYGNKVLSDKLKLRALTELKDIPKEELTIPKIQKIMLIGYSEATAIRDWMIAEVITKY